MEALDSLGIDFKILLAQIINFLLLLLILRKFLYGPIVGMLDKRKKSIEEGLKNAEDARLAVEKAQEDYEQKISAAVKEADKILTEAKNQAKNEAEQIVSAANKNSTEMIEKTKKQIETEKTRIISEAKRDLADLVIRATEKIIAKEPDKNSVKEVIDEIK